MIHVLSGYPDNADYARLAAAMLAESLDSNDSVNVARYYDLIGGPLRARFLATKAIAAFQRGRQSEARTAAQEAISDFRDFYAVSPHLMLAGDHMLYGQCEMINAATDDDATASGAWSRAAEILYRSLSGIQCLKLHFLIGTCHQKQRDYIKAAEQFQLAIETSDDELESMRALARLLFGEALLNSDRADSAVSTLQSLTEDSSLPIEKLDINYPRYWTFGDMCILDDAQYLIAQCFETKKDNHRAAAEFIKVCRFYPGSDRCSKAKSRASELIQQF